MLTYSFVYFSVLQNFHLFDWFSELQRCASLCAKARGCCTDEAGTVFALKGHIHVRRQKLWWMLKTMFLVWWWFKEEINFSQGGSSAVKYSAGRSRVVGSKDLWWSPASLLSGPSLFPSLLLSTCWGNGFLEFQTLGSGVQDPFFHHCSHLFPLVGFWRNKRKNIPSLHKVCG